MGAVSDLDNFSHGGQEDDEESSHHLPLHDFVTKVMARTAPLTCHLSCAFARYGACPLSSVRRASSGRRHVGLCPFMSRLRRLSECGSCAKNPRSKICICVIGPVG